MRMIDADALKKDLGMGDRCEDCPRDTRDCRYAMVLTRMDVCEMLDEAPTVGGWVSVQDRLPENRSMCLTYSPKGKMRVAEAFLPNPDDYPNECWWSVHGQGGHHYVAVTHWMPLPEPPEEVSVDD